jgi:predicted amidohydrolase
MKRFRLGMGQMHVEPGDVEANLFRAEQMIERAARERCEVIVLPECMDVGWLDERVPALADEVPGPRTARLARAAQRHRLFVACGMTERDGDRFYNAAVLLSPSGGLLLKHRKINELRFGQPWDRYSRGNLLNVAHTPLAAFGLNICADNFASSTCLGHSLGLMGANVLLSPCAWAVPADHDNAETPYGDEWVAPYAELATRHNMWVIGVSNVGPITSGPWKGRRCIGNSLAMRPDGHIERWGRHGEEELIVIDIRDVAGE